MKKTTKRIAQEILGFRFLFLAAVISMILSGISSILPSWFVKISVDGLAAMQSGQAKLNILPQQVQKSVLSLLNNFSDSLSFIKGLKNIFILDVDKLLYILPLSIIFVFSIEAILKFTYQYCSRLLGLNIVRSMRERFHEHLNKISMKDHKQIDSGSLVSVISSDLQSLQSWLAETMMNLFSESFKAIFLFAWLMILNWKLTLISATVIPFFAIPVIKLGKGIRKNAHTAQDAVGKVTSFVSESIYNQSIIKAYNSEHWRQTKFKQASNNVYEVFAKWVLYMALVSPLTNLVGAIGIAAILFYGLQSVQAGNLTVGEFSSFFVTSLLLYDPVKRLGRVSTIFQSALGVADRVYNFLDIKTQEDFERKPKSKLTNKGRIEFKNVDFSYDKKKILSNIQLKIPAQSSLALVGPSGGGKTTLVSLLPRFYEIDSGSITIDDTNIQDIDLFSLREQIALVTQEPLMFSGSIRENIVLDKVNKDPSKLKQAVQDAYLEEFISKLEHGLDSQVGEAGSMLSIGQKQRIAIARALYSEAPIVILDEPTSALDNESQEYIYKSISKLMQSRTVIIIAHRLNTIESCDKIAFIDQGQVLEYGSHEDLTQKQGNYANLRTC